MLAARADSAASTAFAAVGRALPTAPVPAAEVAGVAAALVSAAAFGAVVAVAAV